MLSILMTTFLSFSILGAGNTVNNSEQISTVSNGASQFGTTLIGPNSSSHKTVPNPEITLGEFETGSWKNGWIGRHEMLSIKTYSYLGFLNTKTLSPFFNTTVFNKHTFTWKINTLVTNAVSTTIKESASYTSKIIDKIAVDQIGIDTESSVTYQLSIENTYAYTYSVETEFEVSFQAIEEVVNGRSFALCLANHVFKIECEKWQYDDYWWGNTEVSGSRTKFTTYLTMIPTVTALFEDGEKKKKKKRLLL